MRQPQPLAALAALVLGACAAGPEAAMAPPTASAATPAPAPLEGAVWVVEDVDGGGMVDRARVDFRVEPGDGGARRIAGRSGCNRFTGSFSQTGDRISIGPLAGTRMACPPALMELEDKVLKILAGATSYRVDATGAVILSTAEGRTLKARREG